MIFSGIFFKKKYNGTQYVPKYYEQKSSDSLVTQDGKYDMKHLSHPEIRIISSVLKEANQYPPKHRALGLMNECYGIIYKPKYVLNEICIQKYSQSTASTDLLAVALAYASKGAVGRKTAIEYFERVSMNRLIPILSKFICLSPLMIFSLFMDLYEKEHQYEEAISCAKMAISAGGESNHFKKKITELEGKIKAPPIIRNRKLSADAVSFEEEVQTCAARFISGDLQRYIYINLMPD